MAFTSTHSKGVLLGEFHLERTKREILESLEKLSIKSVNVDCCWLHPRNLEETSNISICNERCD